MVCKTTDPRDHLLSRNDHLKLWLQGRTSGFLDARDLFMNVSFLKNQEINEGLLTAAGHTRPASQAAAKPTHQCRPEEQI